MPDPYATPSSAREFYGLDEDASGPTFNVPYRNAARLVQRFAPVPDPEPEDYAEMAADAELEVGRYLFNSVGGSLSSLSSQDGGLSFNTMADIRYIISQVMGGYSTAGRARIRLIERG